MKGKYMLDICLLGTGGMMPLPYRWLTSMLARCQGSNLLIDCGEGTQIAIRQKGWSPNPIDVICFTHYHADHISGLPGLLLTIGNTERTEPILLIGPKGLKKVVSSLRVICPELPFELKYYELKEKEEVIDFKCYKIEAYYVNHGVPCYGYAISVPRKGRFDVEKAKSLDIPMKYWSKLQKGEIIEDENSTYTPDMVMGEDRRGLKVAYCTDTRPTPNIEKYAKDADLFICEGMYGDKEKADSAKSKKHMTMQEGANIAKNANVKELWFTHYSPSFNKPDDYIDEMRQIFKNAKAARDGWSKEFTFDDD